MKHALAFGHPWFGHFAQASQHGTAMNGFTRFGGVALS
jgi:hypothetical protein